MNFRIPSWNPFKRAKVTENLNYQSLAGGEEGEEGEDDYFERLLDRLILDHILDKIRDAESLCKLSMASKRMARLVFQAETVSVEIPYGWGTVQNDLSHGSIWRKLLNCLFTSVCSMIRPLLEQDLPEPKEVGLRLVGRLYDFYFQLLRREKFLGKFTSMRSLNVEYDFCCCSTSEHENPIVKFKFGPNSGTLLMARRAEFLDNDIDSQGYENDNNDYEFSHEVGELIKHWTSDSSYCRRRVVIMLLSMQTLLNAVSRKGLQMLQNVALGDRKHGKIVLAQSDFDAVRDMEAEPLKSFGGLGLKDFNVRIAPVLKLPSSGRVMRTVVLVTYKNHDINNDDADEYILKEGFGAEDEGGEEAYVKEAAMAMLDKEVIWRGDDLSVCLEVLQRRV